MSIEDPWSPIDNISTPIYIYYGGASGVVATSFVPGRDLSSVQRVEGSILTGDALVKRLKSGTSQSLHHRLTRASPTLTRDVGQRSSLSEGGLQWH